MFPSTCDAFQNLSEVWRTSTDKPCFKVTYPKKASGEAARQYLQREFELLEVDLEEFSGVRPGDQGLRRSVRLYNETRRLMRELDERRAREPGFLSVRQNGLLMSMSNGFSHPPRAKPAVRQLDVGGGRE